MGTTMRIRPAYACDLFRWDGLTHRDEPGPVAKLEEDIFGWDSLSMKEYKILFESSSHKILVAEHLRIPAFFDGAGIQKKILGYLIFEHIPPANPMLLHVAVARDERRQGIATALIKEMKRQLGIKNEIITAKVPLYSVTVPILNLLTRKLGFHVEKHKNNMIKLITEAHEMSDSAY